MPSSSAAATFETAEPVGGGGKNKRFQSFRNLPKSWIIAAIVFYCASVITVGLLAGLLPRRTQQVTVFASQTTTTSPITATSITTTTQIRTTTEDPSICVDDECNPRLSSDLKVHSYELEYMYNNTNDTTAQGQVIIEFTLKQPVKQLIYHSKRMVKLDAPALFEDGVYRLISWRTYSPNDYITLRLLTNSLFPTNRYRLVQNFVVNLTDGNSGFYQSIFNDGNESMGKLLSTQFEATDARKAFPCFDEPYLKAQFKISIIHPENTIALANFPNAVETVNNGLRRTEFANTFRMSTYLAAWAILPDTYGRRADDEDEPMMTVWARQGPTAKNHTALALEIGLNSVTFFTNYFNTPAAVPPKIDLLAVPEFSAGAMENWGLVTFREDRIIFDEKIASTSQKQLLAETMAHELAHFWFGNYVTCKWWDDLWLNEAMASWLSYKPFTAYYPDWNMELQVLTEDVIPVMWDDAKPSSHPIVVKNVTSAADITSLFDSITYSKGASILRMLEKFAGSNTFRDGLRDYLTSNAFDVGDPSVFYNKLFINISGEDFMRNWLEEVNYPLLNVNLAVENGDTKVVFTQSRFIISNALNSSHLNNNYRWKINIQCVLGGNYPNSDTENLGGDTMSFLLEQEQVTQVLSGKTYSWIKCNRDFQGFYVTEYVFQSNTWEHFAVVLKSQPTFFSDEDKVNLMQDTFLLAYKGLISYVAPLQIVHELVKINTAEFVTWRTFQWHWEMLASLSDYFSSLYRRVFELFAIELIFSGDTTLDTILTSNSNDNHTAKLTKGLQFAFLCRMNHTEAIERANTLFKSIPIEYFNNSNVDINIDADFLSTVYTYHLKNDDNEADWNMMYNYYKIAMSPQEQTRALVAISSTNNVDRLNRLLNEGLTQGPKIIKRQDYFSMIGYMSRHPIGRNTVWTFYKNNYSKLVDTFTLENHQFGIAILSISRSFNNGSYLQEMNQLFEQYPDAGAGASARKQAIDQVNMNIAWFNLRQENLIEAIGTIY